MKKLLLVMFVVTFCLPLLFSSAVAIANGNSWGDVPFTEETIYIDGENDEEIWNKGLKVPVDSSGTHTSGSITYLHDGEYIYGMVEVIDPELLPITFDQEKHPYFEDGVEISFDTKNDGTSRYKTIVNYDNYSRYEGEPEDANEIRSMFVALEAVQTDTGYVIEFKFKLNNGATTGSKIGVNFIVNELDLNEVRTILRTPSKLNANENEVTRFDYIVLSDNKVTPVEEVVDNTSSEELSIQKPDSITEEGSAKTQSKMPIIAVILIVVIASVVGLAAIVAVVLIIVFAVLKKKPKNKE